MVSSAQLYNEKTALVYQVESSIGEGRERGREKEKERKRMD